MATREMMLQRIKHAVTEGNRAGGAPPLPKRGTVGYQGAGVDVVRKFCTELANGGGKAHHADLVTDVVRVVESILQPLKARKLLLSAGGVVDRLGLPRILRDLGYDVRVMNETPKRDELFAADVGITNVHRLIAETGSVVVATNPSEPRSVSLLPPVHIAIAERSQILPDLFDLFDLYAPTQALPPACLTLITGPSKTGDIELKLVTGVHGPGELHVIIVD